MADPFVAEIRMVGFNFAPTGWAFCDGQLLPISQNTALFSLVGTYYGGNGQSTFALPDFQGQSPMHFGQGPGLSDHFQGESGGSATVTLLESAIPAHTHQARSVSSAGTKTSPVGNAWASSGTRPYTSQTLNTTMGAATLPAGSSTPHANLQPYLVVTFVIALQGVFPPRS